MSRPFGIIRGLACWLALTVAASAMEVSVSGLGWWKNREMRQTLERLHGDGGRPGGASAVEDMAFVLLADLEKRGFLRPRIESLVTAVGGGGERRSFVFDEKLDTLLPRDLEVERVEFRVKEGVRYQVDVVRFEGLSVMEEADATAFFQPGRVVPLIAAEERAYSPAGVSRDAANLQGALRERGHAEASVGATAVTVDDESGRVELLVRVVEGPRWVISKLTVTGDVRVEGLFAGDDWQGRGWSDAVRREMAEETRSRHFREGYPDVTVSVTPKVAAPVQGRRRVEVVVECQAGPQVTVAGVRFDGAEHTNASLLRGRVRVEAGDPLDPTALERARRRLGRLGVFSQVDMEWRPEGGAEREVVFTLEEAPRVDASLLFGYGSYEMVRGGVEVKQTNLWGLAHSSRLQVVQSFKSSQGEYIYGVPGLFGEAFDASLRGYGLRREEQSFTREEFGAELTGRRQLRRLGVELSTGYSYESLTNVGNELTTRATDDGTVKVASVNFGISQDRRDHPLQPHDGWRWFGQLELASRSLGGEVDYQRWQLGASWHQPLGTGRWVHVGFNHGGLATLGPDDDAPVNRQFFPGGESSIRGYQSGEAAPRGVDGRFVGAESFVLVNLELEQALTRTWSLVFFVDALGEAARLGDYPFNEELYSAGLGLRYNTLVGPLRVEYGHNLNPRAGDPDGTLHFSVGFPF